MKQFFFVFFLLISSIAFTQPPLYYFDKTRCQHQPAITQNDITLPLVIDIENLFPKEVPNTAISFWQKENNKWCSWTPNQFSKNALQINSTGSFLIVILDPVYAQLIEIEVTANQLLINRFTNCVLHY